MKEILSKLVAGNNLTKEEAMRAQEMILSGKATQAQIACFLDSSSHERRDLRRNHGSGNSSS